jgi:hypothetical protein
MERLSFRRIAIKFSITFWESSVWEDVAYDTIEQYTKPISEAVVARLCRWYPRRVVEGGRKENMLRKGENRSARGKSTVKPTTRRKHPHTRGQSASMRMADMVMEANGTLLGATYPGEVYPEVQELAKAVMSILPRVTDHLDDSEGQCH